MAEPTVWTFFYGSFMNLDVLKQGGYVPEQYEVARLNGFDIRIQPLAILVRSDQHCVYGIVASGTHEQLRRLYSQDWVGTYLPEPVLVETLDGKWRAAFCYIAPPGDSRPASNDYIDRIVGPARHHGFSAWYIARLESFPARVKGHRRRQRRRVIRDRLQRRTCILPAVSTLHGREEARGRLRLLRAFRI